MDPRAKRSLGKSGVELPLFGFGGAPLGELFVKVSDADAEATLQTAWDEGVRYYDTAPWYGRGQSEHRFGRFNTPSTIRRNRCSRSMRRSNAWRRSSRGWRASWNCDSTADSPRRRSRKRSA